MLRSAAAYDEFRAVSDHEIQLRRAGNEKEAAELAFSPQTTSTRNQMHKARRGHGGLGGQPETRSHKGTGCRFSLAPSPSS